MADQAWLVAARGGAAPAFFTRMSRHLWVIECATEQRIQVENSDPKQSVGIERPLASATVAMMDVSELTSLENTPPHFFYSSSISRRGCVACDGCLYVLQ